MIQIQINNITFNVDIFDKDQFEDLGFDNEWRVQLDCWNAYLKEFDEDEGVPYAMGEDSRYYWTQGNRVHIKSADVFIAFLEFCHGSEMKHVIDVETDDIHWIFHDYYHSVRHCYGYHIEVGSYSEEETLLYGLEEAFKFNKHLPTYNYIQDLEINFYNRFARKINCLTDFWNCHIEYEKEIEDEETNSI
jgi:hypothetical protein